MSFPSFHSKPFEFAPSFSGDCHSMFYSRVMLFFTYYLQTQLRPIKLYWVHSIIEYASVYFNLYVNLTNSLYPVLWFLVSVPTCCVHIWKKKKKHIYPDAGMKLLFRQYWWQAVLKCGYLYLKCVVIIFFIFKILFSAVNIIVIYIWNVF